MNRLKRNPWPSQSQITRSVRKGGPAWSLALGLISLAFLPSAECASSALPSETIVHVAVQADGTTMIRLEESAGDPPAPQPVRLEQRDARTVHLGGIEFSTVGDQQSLVVRTGTDPVLLQLDDFPLSTVRLPSGHQAHFQISVSEQRVRLRTPPDNLQPLEVNLPDGARVSVPASAGVFYDLMKDGAYTLLADGEMNAINADGQPLKLAARLPLMVGGPLVPTPAPGPEGVSRWQRRSPGIEVQIEGEVGREFSIVAGAEVFFLGANEEREVSFPNGARLHLQHRAGEKELIWRVRKGHFSFRIQGIQNWRALGFSEQSAALSWNQASRAIDVRNLSSSSQIFVGLPNQTAARVEAGATFQFAQINALHFAASASGAPVSLHHTVTGQQTDVLEGSLLLQNGVAVGLVRGIGARPVNISMLPNQILEVRLGPHTTLLSLGEEQILRGEDGEHVEVQFREPAKIMVKSGGGDIVVQLDNLANVSLGLPAGNGALIGLKPRAGIFQAQALSGNLSSLPVSSADGSTVLLAPSGNITLSTPGSSSLGRTAADSAYFEQYEATARKSTSLTTPAALTVDKRWSFGRNPYGVYENRISEPAVSVVR